MQDLFPEDIDTKDIVPGVSVQEILGRMRDICSRREYCELDIRRKISAMLRGDDGIFPKDCDEIADTVISSLKNDGYIDERRYASAFARDKSSISGWGRIKIRHQLAAKCVPRGIIDEALSEIDEEKAAGKLSRLLEIKFRAVKEYPDFRYRLLRFALSKGYEYDEAMAAVDAVIASADN